MYGFNAITGWVAAAKL